MQRRVDSASSFAGKLRRVFRQKSDSCGNVDGGLEAGILLWTPLGRMLPTAWGTAGRVLEKVCS